MSSITKNKKSLVSLLVSWEMILVYLFVLINLMLLVFQSETYLKVSTIQSLINTSLYYAILVLPMVFILILGDIDVSIASILILTTAVMGRLYGADVPFVLAILLSVGVGVLCGALNGALVAIFKMPAVIVTIATQMLFRGIVEIWLGTSSVSTFPKWFAETAWGDVLGIPISLILFAIVSAVFVVLLHKTKFGRMLYFVGNNPTSSEYAGINVKIFKIIIFAIMGGVSALCGITYIGRLSGVSSSMGVGIEMDVIAICVLGGVSTAGGKGKMYGPIIATFIYGFLFYALGLMGVEANTRKIVTGLILIITVIIPMINKESVQNMYIYFVCKNSKEIYNVKIKCKNKCLNYQKAIDEVNMKDLEDSKKQEEITALTNKINDTKDKSLIKIANIKQELKANKSKLPKKRKA